jgi:quinol-cytochrome oxidoreductase complex cytochrome b subunit
MLLHLSGSTNPLGVCSKLDVVRFFPRFIIKDIFGILGIIGLLAALTVFFYPNVLGHPDNYQKADALITPKHIVPEWYFLSFYAILRAIPDKLGGVIAMFASILALVSLGGFYNKNIPLKVSSCLSVGRSGYFFELHQICFGLFIGNVFLLG